MIPMQNNNMCQGDEIFQQKDKKINFQGFTENLVLTGHTGVVLGIDICKQRNLLASGSSDGTVKLWSLEDNSLLKTYQGSGFVLDVVFSNEGNLLAFEGESDCTIKLIDISDLKKDDLIFELKGHEGRIYILTCSNDSQYLISGSDDRTIRIWDIKLKKESFQLKSEHIATDIAISSDDSLLASNTFLDGQIIIFNFQNQKLLCTQQAHTQIAGIKFSNDQKMLVSSGFDIGIIKLWGLEKLNQSKLVLIRKFEVGPKGIWRVLFSPCSRFIISMSNQDRKIKIIDSETGEVVKLFKSQAKNNYIFVEAAISKDMDILAYGEDDNISVWRQK